MEYVCESQTRHKHTRYPSGNNSERPVSNCSYLHCILSFRKRNLFSVLYIKGFFFLCLYFRVKLIFLILMCNLV